MRSPLPASHGSHSKVKHYFYNTKTLITVMTGLQIPCPDGDIVDSEETGTPATPTYTMKQGWYSQAFFE